MTIMLPNVEGDVGSDGCEAGDWQSLRLFCPLVGTAGALDNGTDDIIVDDVKRQWLVMSLREILCSFSRRDGSFP